MASHPTTLADRFAGLRAALQDRPGDVRPESAAALDAMLITLLLALLGRLEVIVRAWHPLPTPEDQDAAEAEAFARALAETRRLHALLYVFGPRRNRGMRPRARTTPIPRPRTARAPPRAVLPALSGYALRPDGSMGLARTPRDDRTQTAPSSTGGSSALAGIARHAALTGLSMASRQAPHADFSAPPVQAPSRTPFIPIS